jgi:hypothetical protein
MPLKRRQIHALIEGGLVIQFVRGNPRDLQIFATYSHAGVLDQIGVDGRLGLWHIVLRVENSRNNATVTHSMDIGYSLSQCSFGDTHLFQTIQGAIPLLRSDRNTHRLLGLFSRYNRNTMETRNGSRQAEAENRMDWEHLDGTDELEDREYPDEPEGADLPDDDLVFACPECGADVFEDAEQCPECGFYITESTRTAVAGHWKLVAVVLLAAFAAYGLATLF